MLVSVRTIASLWLLMSTVPTSAPGSNSKVPMIPASAMATRVDPAERSAQARLRADLQGQVAILVAERSHAAPGSARDALDRRIVELKRDGWMRALAMRAQFARARGDEDAARNAERLLEQVRHPFTPPARPLPQSPDKSAEGERGGR